MFAIIRFVFFVSQVYWAWRGYRFAARRIPSRAHLWTLCGSVLALYLLAFATTEGVWSDRSTPVHLTWRKALIEGPFLCWEASSVVAFLVAILFAIPQGIVGAGRRLRAKRRAAHGEVAQPARRVFLERTAAVAAGAPFVAGAYGLLYGRLNLETTEPAIRLARLPRAFDGFRICQISDIHIGPFMPFEEIRKYVAIANAQKADMIVLTGDFVTFDPATQKPAVDALRGLRAPFGVYGCLGNHDMWARVEDSITALFRQTGVRILRGENVAISTSGESFNLIGVDFQSPHRFGPSPATPHLLANIEGLIDPNRTNILLSHNPDTFPRAAELGVDFSLAGHTHGGQLALEFISPEIAPSRLVTPYVAGLFQKQGGQLYVNRGIGTVFFPIRAGAPPEITVYRLVRA
jgi:predicted MPP superfamily phosphohydrolase